MQKLKIISLIIVYILIINISLPIYADDELEEVDVTPEEIEQILEATTNVEDAPIINSRKAVIYDRITRRNPIWERRKHKM